MQRKLKGTRFNYLNCLLPQCPWIGEELHKSVVLFALSSLKTSLLCEARIYTITSKDEKEKLHALSVQYTVKYPRAFPTVHSARACFK